MTVIDANSANQINSFTRPQAREALTEVISFYQNPDMQVDTDMALEHAAIVGQSAMAALGGEQFRFVESVHHNEAFPFQEPRITTSTPYLIGVAETARTSVVHLDHLWGNSQETVGIVAVPKSQAGLRRSWLGSPELVANFQGSRYCPTDDPRHFGRVVATGASWLLRSLH